MPLRGKLVCKNNRWFVESDGKSIPVAKENSFSNDFSPEKSMEYSVDFERDSTPQQNAWQVREAGKLFTGDSAQETQLPYQEIKRKAMQDQRLQKKGNRNRGNVQSDQVQNTATDIPTYQGEFRNPYNFIPAPPRNLDHPDLGDRPPAGHQVFHPDLYSGTLKVTLETKTPLLLLDTSRGTFEKKHWTFPVRIDDDGKPLIETTAIKGMLRSAYEAITNSRMSLLRGHASRLAFRSDVKVGIRMVPVRIVSNGNAREIQFLTGDSNVNQNGRALGKQYAAWVPMYQRDDYQVVNGANRFKLSPGHLKDKATGSVPEHGKKIWGWVEERPHRSRRFSYWCALELSSDKARLSKTKGTTRLATPGTIAKKIEGYYCATGKTMKNKHDERVFFVEGGGEIPNLPLEEYLENDWKTLIKNYRITHSSDFDSPPVEKISDRNRDYRIRGQKYSLEWSRHIRNTTEEETNESADLVAEDLREGTLCYAAVAKTNEGWKVEALYPVMIPRMLFGVSSFELARESNIDPASSVRLLSPADRVFGCVVDGPAKGESSGYRGHIRLGPVSYIGKDEDCHILNFEQDLPLNILGQPKPQQARFYVAASPDGEAQKDGLTNPEAGYSKNKGLRGRKTYPHQASEKGYWFEDKRFDLDEEETYAFNGRQREYIRPKGTPDKQNRSVKGWVKQDARFDFEIQFNNLSKFELGALYYLLSLPENHHLKLGGGKPFGFGSVSVSCETVRIASGDDLREAYLDPFSVKDSNVDVKKEEFISSFTEVLKEFHPKILPAFEKSASGYNDGKPTHYPRVSEEPDPEGKNYEWFVKNNSGNGKKIALGNVNDDKGLPYDSA